MSIGIILMSRAPIPGRTKTRLQSHLEAKECANLHRVFLDDISRMLLELKSKYNNINFYLAYTPKKKEALFTDVIPKDFNYFLQKGDDLGEKMYNCLDYSYQQGDQKQIILGSDLPALQPHTIRQAIDRLDDQDIVIGPSFDGGYYLMGTRKPQKFLFNDVSWGENKVLENTIAAIKERSVLSCALVDKASDVDLYYELMQLYHKLSLKEDWERYPRATAEYLKGLVINKDWLGGRESWQVKL